MTKPCRPLPDLKYLNECFDLDRRTGQLIWKSRPREHFTCTGGFHRFTQYSAGRPAGNLNVNGYYTLKLTVGGISYKIAAHRIVWKMVHGRDPVPTVDHIDRDRSNNKPENLREATMAVQASNRPPRTYRKAA